jgi:copper chaperone CopZ
MYFYKVFLISCLILFINPNKAYSQGNEYSKNTFKVWGNCDMCKTTIEKPFQKMEGIKSAKWNVVSKKMTVKFDTSKTSLDEIKKIIASVGYDTEEFRASDEVYSKLHGCCQYERPLSKSH